MFTTMTIGGAHDAGDLAWLQAYQRYAETYVKSASNSSSSEEEEEEASDSSLDVKEEWSPVAAQTPRERVARAQAFCRNIVPGLDLTDDELDALHCSTEQHQWVLWRLVNIYDLRRPSTRTDADTAAEVDEPQQQQHKNVFKLDSVRSPVILNYMVHNYVHTTKFTNRPLGAIETEPEPDFDLRALAKNLMEYQVELTFTKFAKVVLRLLGALSLLIYDSLVVVETGSDNQARSRQMLAFLVDLLRTRCGYPNLRVRVRACQNIVLTGQLNYALSLEKLMAEFHDAIKPHKFPGVIIRLTDLQRWHANRGNTEQPLVSPDYDADDDDAAFLRELNHQHSTVPQSSVVDEEELLSALRRTDEFEQFTPTKVPNGTFLVFGEGGIISTGCNREQHAHFGFALLFQLLERCRV